MIEGRYKDMKKKKGHDFPEINYTFMDKSTYRKKHTKAQQITKWIVSIIIITISLFAVLYLLVFAKNPNFFKELSDDKEVPPSSTSIPETDNNAILSPPTEVSKPIEEPKENTPPENNSIKSVDTKEKIQLQMEFYGLKKEEELTEKKNKYYELTGEFFDEAFLFPSDVEIIPDELLTSSNKETAAVLRNEIFARHGYPFESGRLLNYFKLKKWYQSTKDKIELTELEKTNINKILQYEISKGWK